MRRSYKIRKSRQHRRWQKQKLQVDLARKDFYPDFNVQYMWQRTDPTQFRAYYMLSVGVRVPIYRGRKQKPELVQAQAELSRTESEREAQSQQVAAEVRLAYDTAQKTAELLKIYREGLLPQARAGFQAGVAAYQNNRQDFQALLSSFLDVLHLDEEYWQNSAEHETALARLEELTGLFRGERRSSHEELSHGFLASASRQPDPCHGVWCVSLAYAIFQIASAAAQFG